MDLQRVYVDGQISYTMRGGNAAIAGYQSYRIEAPDEATAGVLALAAFEVYKKADASYDPAARWTDGAPRRVVNLSALGIAVGDRVMRKADSRRGFGVVGTVERI